MALIYDAFSSQVKVNDETIEGLQSIEYAQTKSRRDIGAIGTDERIAVYFGLKIVTGKLRAASANSTLDGLLQNNTEFSIIASLKHGDTTRNVTFDACFLVEGGPTTVIRIIPYAPPQDGAVAPLVPSAPEPTFQPSTDPLSPAESSQRPPWAPSAAKAMARRFRPFEPARSEALSEGVPARDSGAAETGPPRLSAQVELQEPGTEPSFLALNAPEPDWHASSIGSVRQSRQSPSRPEPRPSEATDIPFAGIDTLQPAAA